jgi:RHS repeat-associated protein
MADWDGGGKPDLVAIKQHISTSPTEGQPIEVYILSGALTDPDWYNERYVYDASGHGAGIGRRTGMSNADVAVSWEYDNRGRVTAETRSISTNTEPYTFRYTYDSASRLRTTQYPNGEIVTQEYTEAWQPKRLSSPLQTYVQEAVYNERGQLTQLVGGNNNLNTAYTYYGVVPGDPGLYTRLKRLQVGAGSGLLRLDYDYNAGGNVTLLTDDSTANQTQTQTFVYDELDRLIHANTNAAGDGRYDQSYSYDQLGSFQQMAGRTYIYDTQHPQAVRYAYLLGTNGRFDPFDNANGWTPLCGACALTEHEGEQVLRNGPAGQGASEVRRNEFNLVSGQSDMVQVEFKVTGGDDTVLQIETIDGGGSVVNAFGVAVTPIQPDSPNASNLRIRRKVNSIDQFLEFNPGFAFARDTWYVVRIYTSGTGPQVTDAFRIYLWQRDDPARRAYYQTSEPAWAGLSWRFHNWVNTQGSHSTRAYLDGYFELKGVGAGVLTYRYDANGNMTARTELGVGYSQSWDANNRLTRVRYGSTSSTPAEYTFQYDPDGGRVRQIAPDGANTIYVGNGLYELTTGPAGAEARSYYVLGSQRVAMRQVTSNNQEVTGQTVTWLHGDHLGSTSLASNSSGALVPQSHAYYLPFGDARGAAATGLPTDFRFTGQRLTADIGLIQMGARWYNARLGRWTSADTVVPGSSPLTIGVFDSASATAFSSAGSGPGLPLALNRYTYVGNNPLHTTDPDGHCFPFCIGGAVIGAIAGAAIYAGTALASGQEINPTDLLIATGTGAVGGFLIGTGVGAGPGVAAFAAIGAGGGVLAGQAGYSIAAGKDYSSSEMLVSAAVNGAAGAITGVVGAPAGIAPIANPVVATGIRFATSAAASSLQYAGTQLVNNKSIDTNVMLAQGAVGLVTAGIGEKLGGGGAAAGHLNRYATSFIMRDPVLRRIYMSALLTDTVDPLLRSLAAERMTGPLTDFFVEEVTP